MSYIFQQLKKMIIRSQMMTYDGEKIIDALIIINNFYVDFFPKIFKHMWYQRKGVSYKQSQKDNS